MKRLTIFTIAMMPLSLFASEIRFSGTATPIGGGDSLYQEIHTVSGTCEQGKFTPEDHSVDYTRSGSEPFATKTLSYSYSPLRPSVEFRQPDFSEVIEITNKDDEVLEIVWKSPSGLTERSELEVMPSLVADSGFDNFVRQNWTTVIKGGGSVEFNIVAPTRGDYYEFTLEPASDDRIKAEHQVRIRPSGMFMGFLVDPIVLGYNDDGLLTDYLGLTNIRKNEDTNYTAHIRYELQTAPECELTR